MDGKARTEEKGRKEKMRKDKGITLIALMITIIILLILAGVTITMLMSDNGLLNRAKDAKVQTDIASIKEQIQMEILAEQAKDKGNLSEDRLKEILEKYGVLSGEENLIDKTLTTTKGSYEIKVSDIFDGTTIKDVPNNPTFTKVANAPDINGFNMNNTYYVSWDLTSSPYTIKESTLISETAPSNWYDYTERVNHWANVKTTGGGNDCYWVWIPRYAYCITEGYHSVTAETIEVKFLKGTTNTPIDGSSIEIKNQLGSGNWNVHPAFWFDKNNNGVEEDGEQLTGIWVAKYEASSSSVSEKTVSSDLNGYGGGNVANLQVSVKPNVTSWRGINVDNIFKVCQNLTKTVIIDKVEIKNSLADTTNLDSHMMKNTEWGAVAYLSRSVYGKNGEVWNNPFYNNTTNYSPITGLCGREVNDKDLSTTNISKTIQYNEVGGGNASTTGNVYGVYDMAGGAWEYVAGIFRGATNNTSQLWDSSNLKYADQYITNKGSQADYYQNYQNKNQYGDAVYETSSSGNSSTGSWHSSYANFLSSNYPIFVRGGRAGNSINADVFAFIHSTEEVNTTYSFRPVVIIAQ